MTLAVHLSVLAAGFTLGLVHALDPDHLMTVSSLAARENRRTATVRFAALWALGHGGLLVAVAAAVVLLGWTLPAVLPESAERAVGLVLMAAGASALWLRHPPHGARRSLRESAPFAVGLVHGLAGSAAMLALIPASLYHPALGLAYAVLFSLGVLGGMLGFALALDRGRHEMFRHSPGIAKGFRLALGTASIGMGLYWIQAA